MSDRYAVFGNPVSHSRSPDIHHAFAAQRGEDLVYERIEAPVDGFPAAVTAFFVMWPVTVVDFQLHFPLKWSKPR